MPRPASRQQRRPRRQPRSTPRFAAAVDRPSASVPPLRVASVVARGRELGECSCSPRPRAPSEPFEKGGPAADARRARQSSADGALELVERLMQPRTSLGASESVLLGGEVLERQSRGVAKSRRCSCGPSSGDSETSSRPMRRTSRWPARLPESTVETYAGRAARACACRTSCRNAPGTARDPPSSRALRHALDQPGRPST